ncbi:hypothetical protein [Hippea sp. KM1]|nr:hypothetical protein [Hippea sp. KM1]
MRREVFKNLMKFTGHYRCTPEEYLENHYRNTDKREEETQQVEQKEAV